MTKEEIMEMFVKAFGNNWDKQETPVLLYECATYDSLASFAFFGTYFEISCMGLEVNVPYREFTRIDDLPDRFFIQLRYSNPVKTFTIWR